MDTLKSATGLSTTTTPSQQSGEEPLSGETGKGTIEEPYDQGNAEGSDGAATKEGMGGALDDTKKKAGELTGKEG
ncbi:hypothetical protein MMC28_003524 [Mycoblastus sanguinarius]|nr:hypothetical protein [Mycoblastus sanguinarius]